MTVEYLKNNTVVTYATFAMVVRTQQEMLVHQHLVIFGERVRVLPDSSARVEEDEYAVFVNPVLLKKPGRLFQKSVRMARVCISDRQPYLVVPSWAQGARGFIALNPLNTQQISDTWTLTRLEDAMRSASRLCTQRDRLHIGRHIPQSRFHAHKR